MIKKILFLLIAGIISITSITGCKTTGEMTGEGVEKVEEGAEAFEEGYEEGRD